MAGTPVFTEDLKKIRVTRPTRGSSFELGMNREVSKNAELDRIAVALLRSSVLKHDEIDEIAARKDLFLSVRRRVITESENQNSATKSLVIFRPRILSFAALAVIAAITVVSAVESVVNRTKQKAGSPAGVAQHDQKERQQQSPFIPPDPLRDERTGDQRATTVAYRPPRPRQERPQVQAIKATVREEPIEFYALADMNSVEPIAGGRVIRVDLPRASLVSLGVDVPLGNDKQLIKTDVLIGPDGVPRAIRVVE